MKKALLYLSLLTLFACNEAAKEVKQIPVGVTVTEAIVKDVPIFKEFVGQTYGLQDIPVRARVEGFLETIEFKEGFKVEKDQLLYTIDPTPFLASVTTEKSILAEKKTRLTKANNDLRRIKPLAKQKAVSQSELDAAVAEVGAAKAAVAAAEANVHLAEIQLGYCKIYSPIQGVIGRTKAREGEFVGKDPNPVILNTISSLGTIRVQFSLTESDYLISIREMVSDRKKGTQARQKENELELILSDGSIHNHHGKLDFIDREVNTSTGSIMIQASFPNPDGLLRPGQFAKVRAEVEMRTGAILVPQKAVVELQGKFSVTILNKDNTITKMNVKVGPKVGDYWIIVDGIKPGDNIVYEGFQKVRNGMSVTPEFKPFVSKTNVLDPN